VSEQKKKDQLLGHAADNDGIDEYDNPLPDWWLGMFILTILWAVGYLVDYHFISDRSQEKYYLAEVEAAKEQWPQQAVAAVAVTPEAVAAGEAIFKQNCVGCHGAELKGGIGPDLTDSAWIHGGSLTEIRTTVTNGVPEKGMLTWGPILGPEKVAQVSAFVYSKGPQLGLEPSDATRGTTPASPSGDGAATGGNTQGAVEPAPADQAAGSEG
jgi:cytochrome c oxidase cbb3-type subunit 3